MSFFKPEDFENNHYPDVQIDRWQSKMAANIANAKLEREGKVVFSQSSDRRYWTDPNDPTTQGVHLESDLQALLINIEPIAKCKHPREKIVKKTIKIKPKCDCHQGRGHTCSIYSFFKTKEEIYECECGARVEPESFKAVI